MFCLRRVCNESLVAFNSKCNFEADALKTNHASTTKLHSVHAVKATSDSL